MLERSLVMLLLVAGHDVALAVQQPGPADAFRGVISGSMDG
jgi:hypothetical protein